MTIDDIDKIAQEAFFGYRCYHTGWGVPKHTRFKVVEVRGRHRTVLFEWALLAIGFGKRPTNMQRQSHLDYGAIQWSHIPIIKYHTEILAKQCVDGYILWCGVKDEVAA